MDTARYATFYCGESRPKPTTSVGEMPSGIVPLYTKTLKDEDTSQVLVEIPTAQGVDVPGRNAFMPELIHHVLLILDLGPIHCRWM
jgi:hypothetical protein